MNTCCLTSEVFSRIDFSGDVLAASVILLTYIVILGALCWWNNRHGNNKFFKSFLMTMVVLIVVAAIAIDSYTLLNISIGPKNPFAIFFTAVVHSIEMFLFQVHVFDNGYEEFFFGSASSGMNGHTGVLSWYALIYFAAVSTSLALIIQYAVRFISNKRWLRRWLKQADEETHFHIFFGVNEIAWKLAADIEKNTKKDKIIFIRYPDSYPDGLELSFFGKIKRLFVDSATVVEIFSKNARRREILALRHLKDIRINKDTAEYTPLEHLCRQLGARRLYEFLTKESNNIYILLENEEENLKCVQNLVLCESEDIKCKAVIYCHASKESLRHSEFAVRGKHNMNLIPVDSSRLAIRSLEADTDGELLPINVVDVGLDANKRKAGYVKSKLSCLIIGFGQTGRSMLSFLCAYGSFSDKNLERSPFSLVAIDENMDKLEGDFRHSCPALFDLMNISLEKCTVNSVEYWNRIGELISSVNYIAVCLGDDKTNVKVAADLAEFAYSTGRNIEKNFLIAVHICKPVQMDSIIIGHYSDVFNTCIKSFGSDDIIWTYDNITGKKIKAEAKKFYETYTKASEKGSKDDTWDKRESILSGDKEPDIKLDDKVVNKMEKEKWNKEKRRKYVIREKQRVINQLSYGRKQDFYNSRHLKTKFKLMDESMLRNADIIANKIPNEYDENKPWKDHFKNLDDFELKVLDRLAATEHYRWCASMASLGYRYAQGPKDTLCRTHPAMRSFTSTDENTRFYNYTVVKTTLQLYPVMWTKTVGDMDKSGW